MTPRYEPPVLEIEEPERVDSIPLIVTILMQMGIPGIIDRHYTPHGNHQGLSVGWLATIFLAYILAESNHKMAPVREWVTKHQRTLETLTGQMIGPTDFTDDRIGDVLRYLSEDELWWAIEQGVSQQSIRVYRLEVEGPVRLDATVGGVNHDEKKHTLFKVGRNKAGVYEVQLKMMLGVLDPLGMPVAGDVVAGNEADDPLYVPVYRRMRKTLGRVGLLYIGDSKMGALGIRAVIVDGQDNYLVPLAMTGQVPAFLDEQLTKLWAGEIELTPIHLPEDQPTDLKQTPDPELAIAEGFEVKRQQEATLADGTTVTWEERALIIRSKAFAEMKERLFEQRLAQTEARLLALTPVPGRGKRQFKDEEALRQAVDGILKLSKMTDLFDIELERQVGIRQVRAYGGKTARTEEKVRYQVHLTRRETAIKRAKRRLGWRVYVTNATAAKLSLTQAVLAYRGQYLAERPFARLKGPLLALLPLYVQRDDHAKGLIQLLTLALRLLVILEFVVRRSLAEQNETLSGLYDGNPKRRTATPSAELLLKAFEDINLSTLTQAGRIVEQRLTPFNDVQVRILELLDLSPDIYYCLLSDPLVLSLFQGKVRPVNAVIT
jgi:transposase